ncbi:MAG: hypothetical protein Q4B64_10370 [Spirochaetales bacterium]|nr:hypothetical protein [Spirochaetales bacterium]
MERAHWSEKRVSGTNVGGIVGNYSSRLLHCKNTGAVTATGENAGGIAGKFSGFNTGTTAKRGIYDCWNSGSVSAGNYAGGIIGYLAKNGSNTDYEVINIVQASASINSKNVKGCFYGKTYHMDVMDGNLFYLNGINLTTSGVPADYYSASATSDTNCDGEENSSDDNQSSVSCFSSAFITKMNTWVSAANAKPWDSTYCPIPEWTSSW